MSLSPVEYAAQFYGAQFPPVLSQHLLNGYVCSAPTFFFMGRGVDASAPAPLILDFAHAFEPAACDAWLVTYMAGDIPAALRCVPHPLPWFIFARDNGSLRRYCAESLTRRLCHGIKAKRA